MQYLPGTWERSPASWRCRPRRIWCRFDWRWIWAVQVSYIHTAWLRLAPCHPPRLVFPSDHTRSSHGFLSRNCIQSTDLVKISRDFVKTSTFESMKQNKTKNKKPKKKKNPKKRKKKNNWIIYDIWIRYRLNIQNEARFCHINLAFMQFIWLMIGYRRIQPHRWCCFYVLLLRSYLKCLWIDPNTNPRLL